MPVVAKLDELGKPAWIALTILGFMVWWPIGLATLAVLLILPLIMSKIPAVLVAVVGATVATGVFDLASEGVDVVGALPQGLPTPAFPSVPLDTLGALLASCSYP